MQRGKKPRTRRPRRRKAVETGCLEAGREGKKIEIFFWTI